MFVIAKRTLQSIVLMMLNQSPKKKVLTNYKLMDAFSLAILE